MKDNNIASTMSRKEASIMDKTKMRKQRYKKLGKGKGRQVGFFEGISLKLTGWKDGRKGFPRHMDDDVWYSTFMNREVNGYEEFCSHTWGSLQIENEERFARLEELMESIQQKRERLETAIDELEVALQREKGFEVIRKNGEEDLTEAQVKSRRRTERDKKLAPVKQKVATLEQEQKAAEDEFVELHSTLLEDDNTTRLICQRVKDHVLMRIDVYWNSALMHHSDGLSMPVIPTLDLKDNAEEAYLMPHKGLMKRAAEFNEAIQVEADKEVA